MAKRVNECENKAQFERRLKAEGRWGLFVQRREALKKAGDGSAESARNAWIEAAKHFPPQPVTQTFAVPRIVGDAAENSQPAPVTPALGAAVAGGGVMPPAPLPPPDESFSDTLRSDALWAYHNATNPLAVADTPGRQLMLARAQGSDTKKEFYALIDRLAVKSLASDGAGGGDRDVRPVTDLISRVLAASEHAVPDGAQGAA